MHYAVHCTVLYTSCSRIRHRCETAKSILWWKERETEMHRMQFARSFFFIKSNLLYSILAFGWMSKLFVLGGKNWLFFPLLLSDSMMLGVCQEDQIISCCQHSPARYFLSQRRENVRVFFRVRCPLGSNFFEVVQTRRPREKKPAEEAGGTSLAVLLRRSFSVTHSLPRISTSSLTKKCMQR